MKYRWTWKAKRLIWYGNAGEKRYGWRVLVGGVVVKFVAHDSMEANQGWKEIYEAQYQGGSKVFIKKIVTNLIHVV